MKFIAIAAALFVAIAGATPTEQANQGELASWGGGRYRPDRYDPDSRRRRGRGRGGNRRGGRRGGRRRQGRYDGRNFNPNDGGQDIGLQDSCSCASNGVLDIDIARDACTELRQTGNWQNLQFDEDTGSCYDDDNQGIEFNGFGAACQNNGPQRDVFNPAYITAICDPNSPDDYDDYN